MTLMLISTIYLKKKEINHLVPICLVWWVGINLKILFMNKIDELLDSIWFYDPFSDQTYHTCDIERVMKEYAEYYAKLVIEEIQDEYGSYLGDDLTKTIILPVHE